MKRSFSFPAAAMALALCACGSLDANTGVSPTLATLQGSLLNPTSVDVSGAVRVAVVWRSSTPGMFNVAEDLPVQPVFPSSFTLDLDGPPPLAAMTSLSSDETEDAASFSSSPGATSASGGEPPQDAAAGAARVVPWQSTQPLAAMVSAGTDVQFAVGSVVAYVDQNGNGKLDLLPDDATSYIDLIVATNPGMAIVYLQGTLSGALGVVPLVDSTGHAATDGYNLVQVPNCPAPMAAVAATVNPACGAPAPAEDAGTADPDAGSCEDQSQAIRWLPMTASYSLTVASTPQVTELLCENGGNGAGVSATGSGTGPSDPSVQPAEYPDPCDPNLSCAIDGSSYYFQTCAVVSQGICEGTTTSCTSVGYTRPTPVPAAWPCTH